MTQPTGSPNVTQAAVTRSNGVIEALVLAGDLSKMTEAQKVLYYKQFCDSLGLNPLTQPFRIMRFQGKEILYATRDAADQLRKRDGISILDVSTERNEDVIYTTVKGKDNTGRQDVETGAVSVGGLRGEALANAYMKALTKAKRRLTLSMCGLGIPDESEIETIDPHGSTASFPVETAASPATQNPPTKRTLSEKAFEKAIQRINNGEPDIINRLRETFDLTDDQKQILLSFEDANL